MRGQEVRPTSLLAEFDAIVLDIDGTLTPSPFDPRIPPECVTLVHWLLRNAKIVGLVTARSADELAEFTRALGVTSAQEGAWSGELLLFPCLAAEVRRIDSAGIATEITGKLDTNGVRAVAAAFTATARRRSWESMPAPPVPEASTPQYFLHDRGESLTIFVSKWMQLTEWLSTAKAQFDVRFLRTAPTCVHVVPSNGGKRRAVTFLREVCHARRILAVADELHQLDEVDANGTDRDLMGADTVVQVGGAEPRSGPSEILFFSAHAHAHRSTLRFFREAACRDLTAIRELSHARYRSRHELASRAGLAFARRDTHREHSKFAEDLVRYLSTVDFEGTLRIAVRSAIQKLSMPDPPSPIDALASLSHSILFMRWLAAALDFGGNTRLMTKWLRDERQTRSTASIVQILRSNFEANKRYVFQPEELPAYLLPLVPAVNEGFRVVCVGKDGEALLPVLDALFTRCQAEGKLAAYPAPIGMKISARKPPQKKKGTVDALQALEKGSLSREILSLLTAEERAQRLEKDVVRRALSTIEQQPAEARRSLQGVVASPAEFLAESSREQIVAMLADAPNETYDLYFHTAKLFWNMCLIQATGGSPKLALGLIEESPCRDFLLASPVAVALRLLRDERKDALRLVLGVFEETLGLFFSNHLKKLRHDFGGILSCALEGTQASVLLNSKLFFVDSTLYVGTTRLYLELLRSMFGVTAPWRFGVMSTALPSFAQRIGSAIEFVGSARIVFEEGRPDWFDFFYDEEGTRVSYERIAPAGAPIEQRPSTTADINEEARMFALEYRTELARLRALLEENGILWEDYFRWWLYRDAVWEMRFFSDKWPFRDYFKLPTAQKECVAFAEHLDAVVGDSERQRLRERTKENRAAETRALIAEWRQRRTEILTRIGSGVDALFAHQGNLVRGYLDEPSDERLQLVRKDFLARLGATHRTSGDMALGDR